MRRDGVSVLVQAARDILGALSADKPSVAATTIGSWIESGSPILRRLAVHTVRAADWMSSDDKLNWLLERNLLYDPSTKHEVFQVLAVAFPEAGESVRRAVLKRVRQGIRAKEEPGLTKQTREYERYNLIQWLSQVASDDLDVQRLHSEEQQRHPDFAPREEPDLVVGDVQVSYVQGSISAEQLLKKRAGDLRVAKKLLTVQDDADRGDTERFSFLGVVGQAAATNPDWGLRLAKSLVRLDAWESDLWRGLADGWSRAHASQGQWVAIFTLLASHRSLLSLAHEAARLLSEFIQLQPTPASEAIRAAEDLSDAMWRSLGASPNLRALEGVDWLTAAINEPGGKLTEFWLRLLSLKIRDSHEAGLTQRDRDRFAAVLAGEGRAQEAGCTVLASQLHFLLAADRDWAIENLLPLFEWKANERRAEQAWQGYLIWAQLNEDVIDKMLPLYVASFPKLQNRPDEWRQRFTEHLAGIAISSTRNPINDGWISSFVRQTSVQSRASWASHLAFLLRSLEPEGKKVQWDKWIRRYWTDRLAGIPRALARAEAGEMAAWTASLEPVFEEAVTLFSRGPIGRPKSYVYNLLEESSLPEEQPGAVVRLLAHALRDERRPFYSCHDVVPTLHRIRSREYDRRELEGVVNQLIGLGCEAALGVLQ